MDDIREEMRTRKLAIDTAKAIEEIGIEKTAVMNDSIAKMNASCGIGMKERLKNMRAEFGDEMFDKIAAGESLMPTLDRWTAEKVEGDLNLIIEKMVGMFKEHGHDEITEKHVMAYINAAS